ncbi:hypothetical protein BKA83DRAFT_4498346 [Pisolithus microcarpus]|nr:hypothetical protein BKA83DRAFT_4498346 [Pisolithus microcarpus]
MDKAEVQATFIVFNSGRGWAFLLGKPLLQALKAKHDYNADQITVTDGRSMTMLKNKYYDLVHKVIMGSHQRTHDIKQWTPEQPKVVNTVVKMDDAAFTRQTALFNPLQVEYIKKAVMVGQDLTPEEKEQVEMFIAEYVDIFACSIKEVLPIPGATINLNIPTNTMLSTAI